MTNESTAAPMTLNRAAIILNANLHRGRVDWKVGTIGSNDPVGGARHYLYSEGEYDDELDYDDWDNDDAPCRLMPEDALIIAQWYKEHR